MNDIEVFYSYICYDNNRWFLVSNKGFLRMFGDERDFNEFVKKYNIHYIQVDKPKPSQKYTDFYKRI